MQSWAHGILGGALIGLSAVLLLWSIGRIAGISGIVNGLGSAPRSDRAWRAAFLVGLMVAGAVAMQFLPYAPARPQSASTPILLLGGLLVGFGTRMGNGCTSGHGVCGLGRLSRRSLAAVMTFMLTAIAMVFFMRHVTVTLP